MGYEIVFITNRGIKEDDYTDLIVTKYLEKNNIPYDNIITKSNNWQEIYDLLNESNFDIIFENEKHETGDNVIGENGNDAIYIISRKRQ